MTKHLGSLRPWTEASSRPSMFFLIGERKGVGGGGLTFSFFFNKVYPVAIYLYKISTPLIDLDVMIPRVPI